MPYSTVSFRMILSDLGWLSKIFNGTKRRAVSLRQLNFLIFYRALIAVLTHILFVICFNLFVFHLQVNIVILAILHEEDCELFVRIRIVGPLAVELQSTPCRDISRPPLGGGYTPDFQSTPLQFKKKNTPLWGCNKLLSNCLLQTWHPCSKMSWSVSC